MRGEHIFSLCCMSFLLQSRDMHLAELVPPIVRMCVCWNRLDPLRDVSPSLCPTLPVIGSHPQTLIPDKWMKDEWIEIFMHMKLAGFQAKCNSIFL